jgi:hypothetical protein
VQQYHADLAQRLADEGKPAGVNRRAWRHKTFNFSSNPFSGREYSSYTRRACHPST